jgi:hypothetical protein
MRWRRAGSPGRNRGLSEKSVGAARWTLARCGATTVTRSRLLQACWDEVVSALSFYQRLLNVARVRKRKETCHIGNRSPLRTLWVKNTLM